MASKNCTKFLTIAIFLVAFLANQSQATFNVSIKKADTPIGGTVVGSKQCGGPGEFVEFRVEGCDKSAPCHVKTDGGMLHAEVDYIPVIDMDQLSLRVEVTVEGPITLVPHEQPIQNSAVKKGEKYTIVVTGQKAKGAKKTPLGLKFNLNNVADGSLRICVQADLEWGD